MPNKIKLISDLTSFLTSFTTYPYLENQQYFTREGVVFQDVGQRRTLISKIKVSFLTIS